MPSCYGHPASSRCIDALPGVAQTASMLPEIEKLLVLQDRDRKIRTLKQELKMAPLERKELDEKLAAARSNSRR